MRYRLKKDLPFAGANTIIDKFDGIWHKVIDVFSGEEFSVIENSIIRKYISNTEWFESLPEKVEYPIKHENYTETKKTEEVENWEKEIDDFKFDFAKTGGLYSRSHPERCYMDPHIAIKHLIKDLLHKAIEEAFREALEAATWHQSYTVDPDGKVEKANGEEPYYQDILDNLLKKYNCDEETK